MTMFEILKLALCIALGVAAIWILMVILLAF